MEVKGNLRRVGNSVMVPIPPELLEESGLQAGQVVRLRSRFGHIDLEADEGPDPEVAAFAARFVDRYRDALKQLAEL